MKIEDFEKLVADSINDKELKSSDIPAVDLYVDQIITLHSDRLKEGSERFHDRQLTKTMINNYAKDRVITPVKGKKYTKEQIIQILFVYTLKGTLSIGEIKRMLDGAYAIDGFDGDSLIKLYNKYTEIKDKLREYSGTVAEKMLEACDLDLEKEEDFLAAITSFVSLSAFMKNIAQAMIDERYPEPVLESEAEKKERKEKEKKEKEEKEKKEKEEKKKKEKEEKEKKEREAKEKKEKEKKEKEEKEKTEESSETEK